MRRHTAGAASQAPAVMPAAHSPPVVPMPWVRAFESAPNGTVTMSDDKGGLTRRDWLTTSSIALSGLALPAASGDAESTVHPLRARLSLNENPFGPSRFALAAIRNQFGEICRYVDEGADALTRAVAVREGVSADQIVLGEILEALGLHLAMDGPRGGEFIYSEPGYTALVDAVAPGGGVVVGVPLNQDLQNDLPAIAAKASARTRAIYLVNPHNPTGTVSDAAMFLALVRELSRRAIVIVDEAYLEFEPDFEQRTVVGLTRAGENVIVFRTFSKIYGLAGLSVGYAVAPKALAASLKRAGIGTFETLDRLALAASAGSLRDKSYVANMRTKVVAEREKWHQLFDALKRRHSDSRGNFVFFETGRPHQEVAAALRARGIDIGRAFPPLDHWARISIGLPQENAMARTAIAELLS
jgi:histidinol-phosphate aminotransferase